jgi:RNA polymerase sigma-B factor
MATLMRFETDSTAPWRAREWLTGHTSLDRKRKAEAGLLLSELVTAAIANTDLSGSSEVTVSTDTGFDSVMIEVEPPTGCDFADDVNGFRDLLLQKMARRWGRDETTRRMWFEVSTPGAHGERLGATSTDELMTRITTDRTAQEEIARRFAPLAIGIARRYRGKGIPDEDLQQVALYAMLKALERYDPEVGRFEPYAARTIAGELKRHLRDRGWAMRVPRPLKERALETMRTAQELTQSLGRAAEPVDIAAALGITTEEVEEALAATSAYTLSSLDAPLGDNDSSLIDTLETNVDDPVDSDVWHEIGAAVALLPERDQRMLALKFYDDLTQSEIAEEIGVSQMHVSRLLARSLERLETLLTN